MNIVEACKLLRAGKKIRTTSFREGVYLFYEGHEIYSYLGKDNVEVANFCIGYLERDDWEEFTDEAALTFDELEKSLIKYKAKDEYIQASIVMLRDIFKGKKTRGN